MKKKVVLGLAIFTSVFVFGGIHLIITIVNTTSALNNLIDLHRVEIMREQLLMNARKIQAGLAIRHTQTEESMDSLIANMARMENQANRCVECHHADSVTRELFDLKRQIQVYGQAFSRFLAARPDQGRMEKEVNTALKEGSKLVNLLHDMTSLTHARLENRTRVTLKKIGDMKTMIFILIFIGPIVAIGMVIVFARELARPLSILLQATRKLKSGDLSFRVRDLKDEFGEMATAFNEMAEALYEQMHNMKRAEQMNMVGEMAAGLVHEIKNPLAGIKGAMQVFQEGAGITQEERAILSQAIDEVQRVEALMKSMLNFAKPPEPQLLSVNINEVLEETMNTAIPYTSLAPDSPKAIRVVKRFDPHLPRTMVDPLAMQQVFLNLLMNAVQAMPSGGTVTATTLSDAAAGKVQIEIADTGTGIHDGIREKIFQPFFTTKKKGTGLGLAISKQFVEMHGGTISVLENPVGGVIFRIVLPVIRSGEAPLPGKVSP